MSKKEQELPRLGRTGPRINFVAPELTPPTDAKITIWGMRILRGIPKHEGTSIGLQSLGEKLSMMSDFATYERGILALAAEGYLSIKNGSMISLTNKGRRVLGWK